VKRLAAISSLALCIACGGARGGQKADDRHAVDRLYPLREGAVWSYDVDAGEGLPILAISKVTLATPEAADVTTGRETVHYERRPDGLFRPDRDAYVLKAPIRVGASWDVGDGATAEVTSIEKTVETASGTFTACAEVVESGARGKVVRTVFCPDVGPAELETTMTMPGGGTAARVYAKLRGYDLHTGSGAAKPCKP
jgi:hypothetical protein